MLPPPQLRRRRRHRRRREEAAAELGLRRADVAADDRHVARAVHRAVERCDGAHLRRRAAVDVCDRQRRRRARLIARVREAQRHTLAHHPNRRGGGVGGGGGVGDGRGALDETRGDKGGGGDDGARAAAAREEAREAGRRREVAPAREQHDRRQPIAKRRVDGRELGGHRCVEHGNEAGVVRPEWTARRRRHAQPRLAEERRVEIHGVVAFRAEAFRGFAADPRRRHKGGGGDDAGVEGGGVGERRGRERDAQRRLGRSRAKDGVAVRLGAPPRRPRAVGRVDAQREPVRLLGLHPVHRREEAAQRHLLARRVRRRVVAPADLDQRDIRRRRERGGETLDGDGRRVFLGLCF